MACHVTFTPGSTSERSMSLRRPFIHAIEGHHHFLLILEKALTFISDQLDVFRIVSRYDNRRACITPYNSKMQFEYTIATEIQEVSGTEEGRKSTERCNSISNSQRPIKLSNHRDLRVVFS